MSDTPRTDAKAVEASEYFYSTEVVSSEFARVLEREVERAYQVLEIHGVPRERAKSVGNGIDVLTTRLGRQVSDLEREVAELRRDAERYRYIRSETTLRNRGYGAEGCWLEDGMKGLLWDENLMGKTKDEIVDAAIDAALGGKDE